MARFPWKRREKLRGIEKRARETPDPVERLRYVRGQMKPMWPLPETLRWGTVRRWVRIAAVIAVAVGAALLVWRIR